MSDRMTLAKRFVEHVIHPLRSGVVPQREVEQMLYEHVLDMLIFTERDRTGKMSVELQDRLKEAFGKDVRADKDLYSLLGQARRKLIQRRSTTPQETYPLPDRDVQPTDADEPERAFDVDTERLEAAMLAHIRASKRILHRQGNEVEYMIRICDGIGANAAARPRLVDAAAGAVIHAMKAHPTKKDLGLAAQTHRAVSTNGFPV